MRPAGWRQSGTMLVVAWPMCLETEPTWVSNEEKKRMTSPNFGGGGGGLCAWVIWVFCTCQCIFVFAMMWKGGGPVAGSGDKNVKIFMELDHIRNKGVLCQL
ncbi:hypothetical protein EDB83DRAFT_2320044 [Lactarius deliciosus]|nr:hypothetical protein EDB83DRAFT_2320044 [Lactarius deliciosus]